MALDSLEMYLQIFVSWVWVLGAKPGSCAKAANDLHDDICLQHALNMRADDVYQDDIYIQDDWLGEPSDCWKSDVIPVDSQIS